MSLRIEKINKELSRKLIEIIQAEVDDPSIGMISITRVETSADLRESRVYFSLLKEAKVKHALDVLNKMKGFIRCSLGKRVSLKIIPDLKFIPDDSIRYSVEIYNKIEEVIKDDRQSPKSEKDN